MSKKQQVAIVKQNSFIANEEEQNYLPAEVKDTGIGNLGRGDYKTPRIILLQGLSPQIQHFPGTARAGHFWHTGLNVPLGDEFFLVPCTASKKVVLWRPRWDKGGGILAFSKDALHWDFGGNTKHTVNVEQKGGRTAIWDTGKDVRNSGLTEWGSFDPDNDESGPAAQEIYEYMCYLPEHPELSPVLFGVQRTGLPNARIFNTTLLSKSRSGRPICSLIIKCYSEMKQQNTNSWFIPGFKFAGYATKEVYEQGQKIADEYKDYVKQADYEQEAVQGGDITTDIDDKLPY